MTITLRKSLGKLLMLTLGILPALHAHAQTGPTDPQPPSVNPPPLSTDRAVFQVRVIEATKGAGPQQPPTLDPKLQDLERELRSLHRDFAHFALIKTETLNLSVGQRGNVSLPRGDFAVQFAGISTDKARRVRHRVEMPGMNATVRAIAPGGRTLDVLQLGDKLVIVATTVGR